MGLFPIPFVFSTLFKAHEYPSKNKRGGGGGKKGTVTLFDSSKIIYTDVIHPQRGHVL